jgi:hypothetical protein
MDRKVSTLGRLGRPICIVNVDQKHKRMCRKSIDSKDLEIHYQ